MTKEKIKIGDVLIKQIYFLGIKLFKHMGIVIDNNKVLSFNRGGFFTHNVDFYYNGSYFLALNIYDIEGGIRYHEAYGVKRFCFTPNEIVERAINISQIKRNYNMFFNNCKDFVYDCIETRNYEDKYLF